MDALVHKVFAFAGFTLDLNRGCLQTEGRLVPLRPKSFELLHYLVENAGRLVPKDELIHALWPGVTVTDDSLTRCVCDVRTALSDHDRVLVRTVHRRGYVFDVPVTFPPEADRYPRRRGPPLFSGSLMKFPVTSLALQWRPGLVAGGVAVMVIAMGFALT